jgi:excinuclease UvrABC nuclease subunit
VLNLVKSAIFRKWRLSFCGVSIILVDSAWAINVLSDNFSLSNSCGEATTASCVVFEKGLPKIKKYRQFNIKNITPGDDYAAMNQAVFRRYSRLLKDKNPLPDVVFIDGGLGQLNQAIMVMLLQTTKMIK